MATKRVRILSDACAAIQSSSCLPIRDRCKQTPNARFYLKQSSFHLQRYDNWIRNYIQLLLRRWIWLESIEIYICLPWYWFLFFVCSWTSAVRDIDLLLAPNFLRFVLFCLLSLCECIWSSREQKCGCERARRTMQIYVVCSTTFKLNLQWHKWTIAMIAREEKRSEMCRMSFKPPPQIQTGCFFGRVLHQLISLGCYIIADRRRCRRDSNSDYIWFIYSAQIYTSSILYLIFFVCVFALMMCSESKFMHTIPNNVGHVKRKRTSAKHILFIHMPMCVCIGK